MNTREIKETIQRLISSGMPKSEIFAKLAGQGVKDRRLAFFIASYQDPRLCRAHKAKVNIIIGFMFLQAAVGFLTGFGIGEGIGPNATWIIGAAIALIPLLFAWGFYKNVAGAYNAYIILTLASLPRQLEGLASSPVETIIGLAIGGGMMAFIWTVRNKLFPDFGVLSPKKEKGRYVFAN